MTRNPVEHIDGLLAELSPMYTIASQGAARFIAGPSGVFVLVLGGDDVDRAAERAGRLAAATRASLADHLSWVPFVDAVVVTAPDDQRRQPATQAIAGAAPATAVPLDMLGDVLVEGRAVVEFASLGLIDDLLQDDALAPWRVGLAAGADKIDLCEPTADTTATA
jgi:hypothetical protein